MALSVGVPTLLITGPGGVGKTTTAFEASRLLESARIGHAMIDLDELDRIYPVPPHDPQKTALTRDNLAAVWANFRAAGASRLILTMVATSLDYELPHVRAAVPDAGITVVRLLASEAVLMERVRRREIGSGEERSVRGSVEQARSMRLERVGDGSGKDTLLVETSGLSVADVAREVLLRAGWLR
jgi:DNA polymerase III delta prime subunit